MTETVATLKLKNSRFTMQGTAEADSTLSMLRKFRDERIAGSTRGKRYTQLYYEFSQELVG